MVCYTCLFTHSFDKIWLHPNIRIYNLVSVFVGICPAEKYPENWGFELMRYNHQIKLYDFVILQN